MMQHPVIAPMAMPLTVLSAATVLAEAKELPQGGLITEIPTLAIAHRLAHHLRHHWPLETPLTLIDAEHQSTPLTLGELAELTEATCPLQLYVPPPLPEALIQFQRLIDVVRELRHPERGCLGICSKHPPPSFPTFLRRPMKSSMLFRRETLERSPKSWETCCYKSCSRANLPKKLTNLPLPKSFKELPIN